MPLETDHPPSGSSPAVDGRRWPRWVVWLAVAACAGVFGLYLQPGFLFTLANQAWACF